MLDSYILTQSSLDSIHKSSYNNAEEIAASDTCWCLHCKETFSSNSVTKYCERGYRNHKGRDPDKETSALCPACGVDAVLGDASGVTMTDALLDALNNFWFERSVFPDDFDWNFYAPAETL